MGKDDHSFVGGDAEGFGGRTQPGKVFAQVDIQINVPGLSNKIIKRVLFPEVWYQEISHLKDKTISEIVRVWY